MVGWIACAAEGACSDEWRQQAEAARATWRSATLADALLCFLVLQHWTDWNHGNRPHRAIMDRMREGGGSPMPDAAKAPSAMAVALALVINS